MRFIVLAESLKQNETHPAGTGDIVGLKRKLLESSGLPLRLQTGIWSFMRTNNSLEEKNEEERITNDG